jgi:methenyltetrahydrofolate cyclohydrolase
MLPGMIRDRDLSQVALEDFRREVASERPMPAGVAIAAVSAGFALGLVVKVLAVGGRRNELAEDTPRLERLTAATQAASHRMLQLAGEDVAAFEAYLTGSEQKTRQQAIDSAVRHAIDLPLAAAQKAAAGLQLCSDVSAFTPPALIADLGVAATLLASALRGFLLCAEANVRQLAADAAPYRERLASETKLHEQALRQAEAIVARS